MKNIVYRKKDPQVYKDKIRTRLKGHEKQIKLPEKNNKKDASEQAHQVFNADGEF